MIAFWAIATRKRCVNSDSNPVKNALLVESSLLAGTCGLAVIWGKACPKRFQPMVKEMVREAEDLLVRVKDSAADGRMSEIAMFSSILRAENFLVEEGLEVVVVAGGW